MIDIDVEWYENPDDPRRALAAVTVRRGEHDILATATGVTRDQLRAVADDFAAVAAEMRWHEGDWLSVRVSRSGGAFSPEPRDHLARKVDDPREKALALCGVRPRWGWSGYSLLIGAPTASDRWCSRCWRRYEAERARAAVGTAPPEAT